MKLHASVRAGTLLCFCTLLSQSAILPLSQIRAGMVGTGRTVFSGSRVEEFKVEILGVLENIGPKQSLILGRLSGGPLAQTGVMQGMSGSPVYVDGKLIGAVAMAFPYSKEPIAGIRPIQEMLDAGPAPPPARAKTLTTDLLAALPPANENPSSTRLAPIATPVWFRGLPQSTVDQFSGSLRRLGLEPVQGVSGGASSSKKMGDPKLVEPGSMISLQLITGDFGAGADGTVTHVDGDRIYAFGHRFLSIGPAEMPFSRAEVLTLLPSVASSFKISTSKETMGVINQDRNTMVSGYLGRQASMAPVKIRILGPGKQAEYNMEIVRDTFLSPYLLQMATFGAIDATERMAGPGSLVLKGEARFTGVAEPLKIAGVSAADSGAAMQASLSAAIPIAFALQSGFDSLKLERVNLDIESFEDKRVTQIVDAYAGKHAYNPGETIELFVVLREPSGKEVTRKIQYPTGVWMHPGPLSFTIADAMTSNLAEYRKFLGTPPKSPEQLVSTLNELRPNTRAYIRVWRPDPSYSVQSGDLPDPPASLAMILARNQSAPGGVVSAAGSTLDELDVPVIDAVVSGSKTIQVEIKK